MTGLAWRARRLVIVCVVAFGGSSAVGLGVKAAASFADSYAVQNEATGYCLDDSTEYGLRDFGCNQASYDAGYQKWMTSTTYPGMLQNAATGYCLDDSKDYGLRVYGCNAASWNSGYQKWANVSGYPGMLANVATAYCLDDSQDYGLRVYGCNAASWNNGYQKWTAITWT